MNSKLKGAGKKGGFEEGTESKQDTGGIPGSSGLHWTKAAPLPKRREGRCEKHKSTTGKTDFTQPPNENLTKGPKG